MNIKESLIYLGARFNNLKNESGYEYICCESKTVSRTF